MKKSYRVLKSFGIGECNISLKKGDEVIYDVDNGFLEVEGVSYTAKNLVACIKAKWIEPIDGKYPELDGPMGESESDKIERKRKERFAKQSEKQKEVKGLLKDEREVGVISEESEMFNKLLNAEPVASARGKSKKIMTVVEDDTREVGKANLDKSESKAMKRALGQEPKEKKDPSQFKVATDHYDAETIHVGTYSDSSNEGTLKGWSKLHWTKKAKLIKSSDDKQFLTQLKGVETSDKIKEKITERLESLQ